jgi:hypothetical protein
MIGISFGDLHVRFFKKVFSLMVSIAETGNGGRALLQEYLSVAKEWRLVRIGDSFFDHVKGCGDGFHSGSGLVEWVFLKNGILIVFWRLPKREGFEAWTLMCLKPQMVRCL